PRTSRRPHRRRGARRTAPGRPGIVPLLRPPLAPQPAVSRPRRLPHDRLPHLRRCGSGEQATVRRNEDDEGGRGEPEGGNPKVPPLADMEAKGVLSNSPSTTP